MLRLLLYPMWFYLREIKFRRVRDDERF